jgi:hypothetical protein
LELSQAQLQADLFLPGGFGGFSSDAGTIEATGPLAFDSSGNLWFGGSEQDGEGFELDGGANLFRLTPQSLADGGYPDISLTVPGAPWASFAFSPIPAGLPIQP